MRNLRLAESPADDVRVARLQPIPDRALVDEVLACESWLIESGRIRNGQRVATEGIRTAAISTDGAQFSAHIHGQRVRQLVPGDRIRKLVGLDVVGQTWEIR